jgi:hypothetical protein
MPRIILKRLRAMQDILPAFSKLFLKKGKIDII